MDLFDEFLNPLLEQPDPPLEDRSNAQVKQGKGLQVFYRWLRESIRGNKPYDQFARELVTASGSGFRNGPVNWYVTGDFGAEPPKTDPRYYYRPWKTILVRTVADGGESFYFRGEHRATLPALWRLL